MLSRYAWLAGGDAFRPLFSLLDTSWPSVDASATTRATPVDILEKEDGLELVCDVPGVGPDDLQVTLENGLLTIHARRSIQYPNASVHRAERYQGEFTRSFRLGDTYDTDSVSATLNNGVLVVRVAKRPEAAPKKIPIYFGHDAANKQLEAKTS